MPGVLTAYLLGLCTLPVLTGLGFLHVRLVKFDAVRGRECMICGRRTGRDRPIVRWMRWLRHDLIVARGRSHRAQLDDYQRKWLIGPYAES